MRCPACQSSNVEVARFCGHCGQVLVRGNRSARQRFVSAWRAFLVVVSLAVTTYIVHAALRIPEVAIGSESKVSVQTDGEVELTHASSKQDTRWSAGLVAGAEAQSTLVGSPDEARQPDLQPCAAFTVRMYLAPDGRTGRDTAAARMFAPALGRVEKKFTVWGMMPVAEISPLGRGAAKGSPGGAIVAQYMVVE